MKKLLTIGQSCLILSLISLSGCQSNETFSSNRDTHIVNFSLKGIDVPLQSSLNELTNFHLHITDAEGTTASYKSFNNIEAIPIIEIKEGNYQVLMVANADPGIFKLPESPLTSQSIISLQPTASNVSELCLSNKPLIVTEDENNVLELMLERVVGKINISVENVPENTDNIQIRINNMFNSVKLNGTYPNDITTCTFNLTQDAETNSFSAQGIILFPTDGNINITYTITDKEGQKKVSTQALDKTLNANGILNITTTLSDIIHHVTPQISLKAWDEPINIENTIVIGQDEDKNEDNEEESIANKITFSGLPNDFTPTKLSIVCKSTTNQLLPSAEVDINSEIAINTPNGASKLIKATFTNAANDNFSVYFGKTGTEGVNIQSIITLPKAPTPGSYYAGGIIINQESNEGYLAYRATAISPDIWSNLKWGEDINIKATSTNDARENDKVLTTFLNSHSGWEPSQFPAFKACRDYRGGGYDDWYFATKSDLIKVYTVYTKAPEAFNKYVSQYATSANLLDLSNGKSYITSSEYSSKSSTVWVVSFTEDSYIPTEDGSKNATKYNVCAVRYL